MKKVTIILGALLMMLNISVYSQTGGVVIANGAATADDHAILDLQSTTKGFLLPRLTSIEALLMPGFPPDGLMILNTTDNRIQIRDDGTWITLQTSAENSINDLHDAFSNTAKSSYYIGDWAGENMADGPNYNLAVGNRAGYGANLNFGTGQYNTAIGAYTGFASGHENLHHTTTLGFNSRVYASHHIVLGADVDTVVVPNTIRILPQISSPAGSVGKLYVEHADSNLYYHDGNSWDRINPPKYQVGDLMFGGVIFFVDESGKHGLVTAVHNASNASGVVWSGGSAEHLTNAKGEGMYGGEMNTVLIVANEANHYFSTSAAQECLAFKGYVGDYDHSYGDWYLPTIDELYQIYLHKDIINAAISGISAHMDVFGNHWSSTETSNSSSQAEYMDMDTGLHLTAFKTVEYHARPVRRF